MIDVTKKNTADGLIERTSSMLHEIAPKNMHKDKEGNQYWGKRIRHREVKPVENISKNPQSFLENKSCANEVLPSHKLQDHA